MRIGNGFDIHRLVVGRPLILGGVHIPFELGLEGHSDGDVLAHAVMDSLLGAAGLGDIGMWFPPGDPEYSGADSVKLLRLVRDFLRQEHLRVVNVDTVVICERPRLSPYFADMRERLGDAMEVSWEKVSVKASTHEGLGAIGRGEAIAVQAVALIE